MPKRKRLDEVTIVQPRLHREYPQNSLLGVPGEIRNTIYNYAFQNGTGSTDLTLLLTCRKIYLEAHLMAFRNTNFNIQAFAQMHGNKYNRKHRFLTNLKRISPQTVAAIKSVRMAIIPDGKVFQKHSDFIRPGLVNPQEVKLFIPADVKIWYSLGDWVTVTDVIETILKYELDCNRIVLETRELLSRVRLSMVRRRKYSDRTTLSKVRSFEIGECMIRKKEDCFKVVVQTFENRT